MSEWGSQTMVPGMKDLFSTGMSSVSLQKNRSNRGLD